MSKGYWVVEVDVTDPDAYKLYTDQVRPYLDRVGGRFIVRGGASERVEGTGRPRLVVVEFASYEAALTAYSSDEYQAMVKLRQAGAMADFAVVEGFDG